ncbi:hypothetical protein POSPLADRAFT_1151667 [Postia placenta MAD-698-R-SB12]|uniref:Uncharacterized protein n=1 Tax=Postia placenta MAD-698-R-SB12 TaxID=670580 RepID=A0A1X6MRR7_9APHY|nr:hypothetical protein POSPLADRAFT_1151667 [Postia placenta MAD-698-R-SB12]OSX58873.1 hypothetical protein POSPLADRAFT_1151667 [Postia placenta MAD-698-R-SB12]
MTPLRLSAIRPTVRRTGSGNAASTRRSEVPTAAGKFAYRGRVIYKYEHDRAARPASRSPTLNLAICLGLCVCLSGADVPCERHHILLFDTVERVRSRPSSDSRASECLSGGLEMEEYVCAGKGAYTQLPPNERLQVVSRREKRWPFLVTRPTQLSAGTVYDLRLLAINILWARWVGESQYFSWLTANE